MYLNAHESQQKINWRRESAFWKWVYQGICDQLLTNDNLRLRMKKWAHWRTFSRRGCRVTQKERISWYLYLVSGSDFPRLSPCDKEKWRRIVEGEIMKVRDTMDFWVLLTLVCLPTSALGSLCPSIVEEEVVLAEEYNKLPSCLARHISSGCRQHYPGRRQFCCHSHRYHWPMPKKWNSG